MYFTSIATWLGWATGYLLIKVPWGPPTFTSWLSPIALWSLVVFIVQHLLVISLITRWELLMGSFSSNHLTRSLHSVILFVAYVVYWAVRLTLLIYAKDLADLLRYFYFYPVKPKANQWRRAWRVASIGICISAILVVTTSIIFSLAVRTKQKSQDLSFSYLGGILASIVSGFFGYLGTSSATNVAFGVTVHIIFYLGMIYCDFCDELQQLIQRTNRKGRPFIVETSSETSKSVESSLTIWHSYKKDYSKPSALQESLLARFDQIQDIFTIGGKIVSPLVLVLVIAVTFRSVSEVHEILMNNNLGILFLLDNYLNLLQEIVHTSLLVAAQYVEDKINEKRKGLQRTLTLLEETDIYDYQLIKVVKCVADFEWRLSAFGFFYVDKRLLSGMMATAMSYIVILVQLQISLRPFLLSSLPIPPSGSSSPPSSAAFDPQLLIQKFLARGNHTQ